MVTTIHSHEGAVQLVGPMTLVKGLAPAKLRSVRALPPEVRFREIIRSDDQEIEREWSAPNADEFIEVYGYMKEWD